MTQEEKNLLLKDLCARLPYGVMLSTPNGNKTLLALIFSKKYNSIVEYNDYNGNENDISEWEGGDIEFVKPYLRPMSSMTEEEEREVRILWNEDFADKTSLYHCYPKTTDFYNKHHLDYRGLIPMGLALEAPEDMYK